MSSNLPDDMTPTMGLNGLMQQYPDEDYGVGVLNPDILPPKGDASSDDGAGEPHLPDGIVMGSVLEGDGELGISFSGDDSAVAMSSTVFDQMMKEGNLADLSWLEVDESDLDPDRLPKDPHYDAIPELEAEWGQHRGQPGIHFHANVDPDEARYRASLNEGPAPRQAASPEVLEMLLRKAMRLSVRMADKPFKAVVARLGKTFDTLPENLDITALKPALAKVAKEHGLAGRVFIRAEAYPGYEQGEWAKEIKRYAKKARYIVVPRRNLKATHHFQGQCGVTGKRVVASIPWEKAREAYAPELQATGRPVEMDGDPREALLTAFRKQAQTMERPDTFRPVHVAPSQRVSTEDAQRALKAHKPERKKISKRAREEERKREAAQLQIADWVNKGLLTKKVGTALVNSDRDPESLLHLASNHIVQTTGKKADYSGFYNEGVRPVKSASPKEVRAAMKANLAARKAAQEAVAAQVEQRVKSKSRLAKKLKGLQGRVQKIAKAIDRGVRGEMLQGYIKRTLHSDEVEAAAKLLDPILRKTGALEEREGRAKAASYSGGSVQREHVKLKTAELAPSRRELEAYVKWARLTLSEGLCGKTFDVVASTRWGTNIRKVGAEAIQLLRDRHEGLSGHLYVDAAAYATPTGTKGCAEGALKNRSNNVKFVLAMDRCAGCTFANRKASTGRSVCQKYNKPLVTASELPSEETRDFQRRMIAESNMTDHEATASLFAPTYDPGEYELTASAQIDEVSIASSPIEPLQDIWFDNSDVELELK